MRDQVAYKNNYYYQLIDLGIMTTRLAMNAIPLPKVQRANK